MTLKRSLQLPRVKAGGAEQRLPLTASGLIQFCFKHSTIELDQPSSVSSWEPVLYRQTPAVLADISPVMSSTTFPSLGRSHLAVLGPVCCCLLGDGSWLCVQQSLKANESDRARSQPWLDSLWSDLLL